MRRIYSPLYLKTSITSEIGDENEECNNAFFVHGIQESKLLTFDYATFTFLILNKLEFECRKQFL